MNTGVEVMRGNLQSWSWKDIHVIYAILGNMLQEYNGVHQRCHVPTADIKFSDQENIFFFRFWGDVKKINEQIKCLDREITRRNNLIGVMG
jgi:hypothetical protein